MCTRNGIYYDLTNSPYRVIVNGFTFVFSSQMHLDKFIKKIKENRDIMNYSLSKRFKIKVKLITVPDLVLYRKIEGRGFLVLNPEGVEITAEEFIYAESPIAKGLKR